MMEMTHLPQSNENVQPDAVLLEWTSAGVPVPDFKERTLAEIEEYAWRFKVYEENYINPYIESLKLKRYSNER